MSLSNSEIIKLTTTDSTNNYAMRLIDADMAQHGTTIIAQSQSHGKGQRGRIWHDEPGQSLLMSIIVTPINDLSEQFLFNAAIAVAIANVLQKLCSNSPVSIKWPNDMMIHDKKTGGILIENVIRGSKWTYSVIGVGINVYQEAFPETLPVATSLKIATGKDIDINALTDELRQEIISNVSMPLHTDTLMKQYNNLLYKKNKIQRFVLNDISWNATILTVTKAGLLEVELEDGTTTAYQHGSAGWEYS